MIAGFTTRGANGLGFGTADTTEDGSNMTAENYIGIAASTVSNNATATIDVSGATNSSQSSLTPGQKYYVQANGTLGLSEGTPKVFAGTAVAATKIIVNDQQPMPEDTGLGYDMWCVSADFGYYREWNRDQALGSGQTFTSPSGTYTMLQVLGKSHLLHKQSLRQVAKQVKICLYTLLQIMVEPGK